MLRDLSFFSHNSLTFWLYLKIKVWNWIPFVKCSTVSRRYSDKLEEFLACNYWLIIIGINITSLKVMISNEMLKAPHFSKKVKKSRKWCTNMNSHLGHSATSFIYWKQNQTVFIQKYFKNTNFNSDPQNNSVKYTCQVVLSYHRQVII